MTNIRQPLPSHELCQASIALAKDCKNSLGEKWFFSDGLENIRALVDQFHKMAQPLERALAEEKDRDAFLLNDEKDRPESDEVKEALSTLNLAKNNYLSYQQQEIPKLERVIDDQYAAEIKRTTLHSNAQSIQWSDEKKRLNNEIGFLLKARFHDRAEGLSFIELAKITQDIQKKTQRLIDLRELNDKHILATREKINSLKIRCLEDKKLPQKETIRLQERIKDAELELNEVRGKTKKHIELQRKLYVSGVSPRIMFHCLRVYFGFNELYAQIMLDKNKFKIKSNADNKAVEIPQVKRNWTSPDERVQELISHTSQFKLVVESLLTILWCPESGSKSGIKFYSMYKESDEATKKILLEENPSDDVIKKIIPVAKDGVISLKDLNTKIIPSLPAPLIGNHRDQKSFGLIASVGMLAVKPADKPAAKTEVILIESRFK
jgi:hypothetical protein